MPLRREWCNVAATLSVCSSVSLECRLKHIVYAYSLTREQRTDCVCVVQ